MITPCSLKLEMAFLMTFTIHFLHIISSEGFGALRMMTLATRMLEKIRVGTTKR